MFCRRNVILDLDETLINSVKFDRLSNSTADMKVFDELDSTPIQFKSSSSGHQSYLVFHRPYLQDFLTWLFANYNVGVLTYGRDSYASEIVKHIVLAGPNRHLSFFLFVRYHEESHSILDQDHKRRYNGWKNLEYLFDRVRPFNFFPCINFLKV